MLNCLKDKRIFQYILWAAVPFIVICMIINHILEDNYQTISVRPLVMSAAIILIIISSVLIYKFRHKAEIVFLISYILLGIAFFIAIPLYMAPDEPAHYMRAFEISQGHLVSDFSADGKFGGRELPNNLIPGNLGIDTATVTQHDIWKRILGEELSDNEVFCVFWNTSLYAPVSYIPQSFGMAVMNLFSDSIVLIGYAGRLMNFLAIGLIGFLSIKYAPFGKKIILLILTFPINMQEAVSLAPDAMVTALTCALISFVLYMSFEYKESMKRHHYVILYALCIAISLYKIVYLPFCLFPFLINKERFGGKKQYIRHAVILGSLVIFLSLGWLSIASNYLADFRGADGGAQVSFILSHPFRYIGILFSTIKLNAEFYLRNIIGTDFGWYTIQAPKELICLYAFLALIIVLLSSEKLPDDETEDTKKLIRLLRIVSISVSVAVFLLVFTSLYVQWNIPENAIIEGVQGRYLIPILFPLLLSVYGLVPDKWIKMLPIDKLKEYVPVIMVIILGIHICIYSDIFKTTVGNWESGFRKDSIGSKYMNQDKTFKRNEWLRYDNEWYFFDETGYMCSGEWILWKGVWYYVDDDGIMLHDTWVSLDDGQYYLSGDGSMLANTTAPDGSIVDESGRKIN